MHFGVISKNKILPATIANGLCMMCPLFFPYVIFFSLLSIQFLWKVCFSVLLLAVRFGHFLICLDLFYSMIEMRPMYFRPLSSSDFFFVAVLLCFFFLQTWKQNNYKRKKKKKQKKCRLKQKCCSSYSNNVEKSSVWTTKTISIWKKWLRKLVVVVIIQFFQCCCRWTV